MGIFLSNNAYALIMKGLARSIVITDIDKNGLDLPEIRNWKWS